MTNLTTKELAKELSLNVQYVRDAARFGKIPGKKIGTSWRFDLEKVEEALQHNGELAVQRALINASVLLGEGDE